MKHIFITAAAIFLFINSFCQAGTLDKSFGNAGAAITDFDDGLDDGTAIAIQPDGKIVVVGTVSEFDEVGHIDFGIARYNTDGTLDNTFGIFGKMFTDFGGIDHATAVAIQTDGKIVVAGYTNASGGDWDFAVTRYFSNGLIDVAFGNFGKVITGFGYGDDEAYGVAIQPNGQIVVAGTARDLTGTDFGIIRYNTNGKLDITFGSAGKISVGFGGTDGAYAVAIQSDGKIVAAGFTNASGGDIDYALLRCSTNGTLDNSFNGSGKKIIGFGYGDDAAHAVAIQQDGKIVVAGTAYDGNTDDFGIARLNTNGTPDNKFAGNGKTLTGFGSDEEAYGIAIQSDGKIVAVGNKYSNSGPPLVAMARYKTNGTLDNTFGSNANGKVTTDINVSGTWSVSSIAIQSNTEIVLAGKIIELYVPGDYNFLVLRYHGDNAAPESITSQSNDATKTAEQKLSAVHIYPNPVTNVLHVEGLNASSPVTISITDLSGTVLQKTIVTGNEHVLDVSMLKPGMYYVCMVEKDKTTNIKFIKQ